MRIALVGPFIGSSLAGLFDFGDARATLPAGYPGAPVMSVLARALVDRGHTVAAISTDYLAPASAPFPYQQFKADRLAVYFCPQRARGFRYADGRWGRAMDLFARERQAITAAIRDFAPDIVHAHWTYEFVWAALDSGYPTLATAHDSPLKVLRFMPDLYRAMRFIMARRVIPRCRHLTAVSPDLAADLARFTSVPIQVVPNPVSTALLQGPGCEAPPVAVPRAMMVLNGWNGLKNGMQALRAFAAARGRCPGLRLVCFGTDWQTDGPAHQWARRERLDGGVEFRGPVPRETILETMRTSTLLLHPSRAEACSMAIAEAMSVGLPVVAGRRTDGVAWQLDGGRAGMLVDVNDLDDMASGVIALASDRARWVEVSARARSRARELFAEETVLSGYLGAYDGVLAAARQARGTHVATATQ